MNDVDRVAHRMTIATITGLIAGASVATYKGLPLRRTSLSVAASFALIGTACFSVESLSNLTIRKVFHADEQSKARVLLASHAVGGMVGGGIVGGIFLKRPIPGMLVFTPAMLALAMAELKFGEMREERRQQLFASTQESTDDVKDSHS